MHTSDRLRTFRSLGLAIAALLLVGGAVFGSQAINGTEHKPDLDGPASATADEQGNVENHDAQESQDPTESPEASPDQKVDEAPGENVNNDVNEDVQEGPGSTADEQTGDTTEANGSQGESPEGESNAD